jgi:hypothetical protein
MGHRDVPQPKAEDVLESGGCLLPLQRDGSRRSEESMPGDSHHAVILPTLFFQHQQLHQQACSEDEKYGVSLRENFIFLILLTISVFLMLMERA